MAAEMLEKEKEVKKKEREATLSERVPPLQMSGLSIQDLQVCASHSHIIIKQRGSKQNKPSYVYRCLHVMFICRKCIRGHAGASAF